KLIEQKTSLQGMPYFDRLDYVAPMNQEHAFCLAAERLLGIEVPRRGQLIRVLYCEIGPLLSHLLNVTTHAMDGGPLPPLRFCDLAPPLPPPLNVTTGAVAGAALPPPLWGFEEPEKLMVFYE